MESSSSYYVNQIYKNLYAKGGDNKFHQLVIRFEMDTPSSIPLVFIIQKLKASRSSLRLDFDSITAH